MIAPWLLYASALGLMIALVALLAERAARWVNRPGRWVWLAAIVTTVALPIALSLRTPENRDTLAGSRDSSLLERSYGTRRHAEPVNLNTPLLLLWSFGSLLLTTRVLGTAVALRRRRKSWVPASLNGKSVLLSEELGPAVIGWRDLTTVIPRWAFTFDEPSRALMLEHEAEHARSGDPYLRSAALVALIAMPWNPAIWWATRRLRLAIEIDCDRRVLARGADPRLYASLLLAVGERMSATPFAWATALGGSRSSLETRIIAMTSQITPRRRRIAIAAVSVAAIGIIAIACASPIPDPVVAPEEAPIAKVPTLKVVAHPYEVVADTIPVERRRHASADSALEVQAYRIYRGTSDRDTLAPSCEVGTECRGSAVNERRSDTIVRYYRGKAEPFLKNPEEEEIPTSAVTREVEGRPVTVRVRWLATPSLEFRNEVPPKCTAVQVEEKRKLAAGSVQFAPRCLP